MPKVLFIRSNPVNPDSRVEKEVNTLIQSGYEVDVLGWDREADYTLREERLVLSTGSAKCYRVGIKAAYGSGIRNIRNLLLFQKEITKFLNKHRNEYDLIHACDFDTAFTAFILVNHKRTEYINLLSVARLTKEKGIERIIEILGRIDSSKVKYYVVGDGIERNNLEKRIQELHLEHIVTLCGEDSNPYRYMLDADLLVVPSFHEAAPVVFQEAKVMGLPVLTTRTTSADEMIGDTFGFVADNNEMVLEAQLREILNQPNTLEAKKRVILKSLSCVETAQRDNLQSIIDK